MDGRFKNSLTSYRTASLSSFSKYKMFEKMCNINHQMYNPTIKEKYVNSSINYRIHSLRTKNDVTIKSINNLTDNYTVRLN